MKRHPFDAISFAAGLVFVLTAVTLAFSADIDLKIGAWLLPTSVLILGIGILAATVRSTNKPTTDDPSRDLGSEI